MDKIYLLTVGDKKPRVFYRLRKLLKALGLEPTSLNEESLPFISGRLKIEVIEVED